VNNGAVNTDYDVIIMGGGLVGASLAACMARDAALRIAVVEKFVPPQQQGEFHPSYDARNTALANGTCHIFDQLGLWDQLRRNAVPIETIEITEQGSFGKAVIRASEERVRALGYVIENRYIGQALSGHLGNLANVDFLAPAQVIGLYYDGPEIVATVEQNGTQSRQRTPLLVIADGAESQGRQLLGIASESKAYEQVAIVTTVTPESPHQNMALERFTSNGPLAILPQTDNRLGLTWCVAPQLADELMRVEDDVFLRRLEAVAGRGVGALVQVGKRYRYPLALTLSKEQVRPNVVVLGNAAHGLHPVAGQGFNMSMRDVAVLVQVLDKARRLGRPAGDFRLLSDYLQRRVQDQRNTILFSDQLTKLFSNRSTPLNLLRNSGLILFDSLRGTKRLVARHAMGRSVSTRLPEVTL